MKKFKNSRDSIVSEVLLWQEVPTQVVVKETYNLKVHPIASLYNEGTINFDIPAQPKGMMSNIDIITTFNVKKGNNNLTEDNNCTIINNFTNALWDLVDVKLSDRISLMQSMRKSYAYQTFFNYSLNSDADREDYLYCTQLFKMGSAKTKAAADLPVFTGENIVNEAAVERAKRIANSRSVTVSSRLHSPLFTTSKALPTNMEIRVSLSKNTDKFLLIADGNDYTVNIENVYLDVSYIRPHDIFLSMIEERLAKEAAPYFITRPEIIIKPIAQSGRIVRINHIFPGNLPKHAFFTVQKSKDFEGTFNSNPFAFIPFAKFQLYIDGMPYFIDPLEIDHIMEGGLRVYRENRVFMQQLYKTIGKDVKGCGLINSTNFQQHFMVGVSLSGDRSSSMAPYLNPQGVASSQLELDFGYDTNVTDDLILMVYAVFDRVIKISSTREIEIIE